MAAPVACSASRTIPLSAFSTLVPSAKLSNPTRLGSELATTLTGRFMTATDVNFALGKLYKAIAQNRIPPRNASNLAFVGKLLLLSLDKVKREFNVNYDYEQWVKMYVESKGLSNPPSVTPGEHQDLSTVSATVVHTEGETETAGPSKGSAGGQAQPGRQSHCFSQMGKVE